MDFRDYLAKIQNQKERKIALKELRKSIQRDSSVFPLNEFVSIPIPDRFKDNPKAPFQIYRSRNFLVQLYQEKNAVRLSVNRTDIDDNGEWLEGISWDTLQQIKSKIGYGEKEAVEIYPKDTDIVNVANIRHLFILDDPLPCVWRKDS
jgi:hypothetical protein